MLDSMKPSQTAGGDEWAERCAYWLANVIKHTPGRYFRQRRTFPLILAGQGLSLRVDKGTLVVKDGFTHYPSEKAVHRFFKGDLALPNRIILVDGSGEITLDALDWLAQQGVTLVSLKWDGTVISAIGVDGSAFDRAKVNWQIEARADEAMRLEFAVPLIIAKADASLQNIEHVLPKFHSKMRAIRVIKDALRGLRQSPPDTINELLRIEGRIAAIYFNSWRCIELKWKGLSQQPVPDTWLEFRSRTALNTAYKPANRNATHPINAMLNYAYTVLESHVRIGVLADGYDPVEGILHSRATRDRDSFVFDMMEPLRPVVDRAVLKLVSSEVFCGSDFVLQSDGLCRLNPELARRLTQLTYSNIGGASVE